MFKKKKGVKEVTPPSPILAEGAEYSNREAESASVDTSAPARIID